MCCFASPLQVFPGCLLEVCCHDVTQQPPTPPPPSYFPHGYLLTFAFLPDVSETFGGPALLSIFQLSFSLSLWQPSEALGGRRSAVMNPRSSHSCGSVGLCDHGKSGPPITAHDVQMFSSIPVNTKGTLPPPHLLRFVSFAAVTQSLMKP